MKNLTIAICVYAIIFTYNLTMMFATYGLESKNLNEEYYSLELQSNKDLIDKISKMDCIINNLNNQKKNFELNLHVNEEFKSILIENLNKVKRLLSQVDVTKTNNNAVVKEIQKLEEEFNTFYKDYEKEKCFSTDKTTHESSNSNE
ncbi:unnamed protein product [Brachionus calyciflorus]|uniref:Uncharacterized protein n=1 Tax=Brachionus calyciflorus TaxID=104777 RepID=A0A814CW24_9BILA|nr:unnamed protein product [Brachionus calyciflorus]